MTDISTLLQEAKPLYFKRKKRRKQIKVVSAVCACALFVNFMLGMNYGSQQTYNTELDTFYAYLYEPTSLYDETDNYVDNEDSVFPVDEYGLITVV